jgi:hypothetical protein
MEQPRKFIYAEDEYTKQQFAQACADAKNAKENWYYGWRRPGWRRPGWRRPWWHRPWGWRRVYIEGMSHDTRKGFQIGGGVFLGVIVIALLLAYYLRPGGTRSSEVYERLDNTSFLDEEF